MCLSFHYATVSHGERQLNHVITLGTNKADWLQDTNTTKYNARLILNFHALYLLNYRPFLHAVSDVGDIWMAIEHNSTQLEEDVRYRIEKDLSMLSPI